MDIGTGLTVLGSAQVSADAVKRILGPTADYLGEGLRSFTEQRVANIQRIFEIANERIGDGLDDEGVVPPRVLKYVVDSGSYCDDELAAAYFGGVLASSRSSTGIDDRGAYLLAMVERLSSYQLRSHYLFYKAVRSRNRGRHLGAQYHQALNEIAVLIRPPSYFDAIKAPPKLAISSVTPHVLAGLDRECLLGNVNGVDGERLRKYVGNRIIAIPTVLGVELFLWAHGVVSVSTSDWLDPEISLPKIIDLPVLDGCSFDASILWKHEGIPTR